MERPPRGRATVQKDADLKGLHLFLKGNRNDFLIPFRINILVGIPRTAKPKATLIASG
jgi:hypothetical protein